MSGDGALAWRPIGPGDAADWAGLLNTISAADRDWEYVSEQDLLEDFSDPTWTSRAAPWPSTTRAP
jgi:hypothetical protein